jgi:predicted phosphate transport protein (TIGR00153 family)
VIRSIIPRDEVFFDRFEKICALIVEATRSLQEMLGEGGSFEAHARRIKDLESESDEQVHHAVEHLHKTFVTPLDRQDILQLATRLDDILDMTEAASSRIHLFRPRQIIEEARQLADVLVRITGQVAEMIGLIRNMGKRADRILELTVEIDRLENAADEVRRNAVARLFVEEDDAKELIKWKDILEHMAQATDRCEDVSDIVEGLVLEST